MEFENTETDNLRYNRALQDYYNDKASEDDEYSRNLQEQERKADKYNEVLDGTLLPIGSELVRESAVGFKKTIKNRVKKGVVDGIKKVKSKAETAVKENLQKLSDKLNVDPSDLANNLQTLPDAAESRVSGISNKGEDLIGGVKDFEPIRPGSFDNDLGSLKFEDIGTETGDAKPSFMGDMITDIYRPIRDKDGKLLDEDFNPLPDQSLGDKMKDIRAAQDQVQQAVSPSEEDEFGDPTQTSLQEPKSLSQTGGLSTLPDEDTMPG